MNIRNVEVIVDNLENNPYCFHGPSLLFKKLTGQTKKYYACSACRDHKDCSFYVPVNEKDTKVDLSNFWKKQQEEAVSKIKILKPFKRFKKILNSLKHNSLADRKETSSALIKNNTSANKILEPQAIYCYTCNCLFDKSDTDNHIKCKVLSNLTCHQLTHPTEILIPNINTKTQAQYFFSKSSVKDILLLLTRLNVSHVLCIGVPRIHEYILNECQNKIKSLLLDLDKNYYNFYSSTHFIWYNMFNNFIFDTQQEQTLFKFLKSDRIVILIDPPFGGRVEPLARTLNMLSKTYQEVNSLEDEHLEAKMETEENDSEMDYSDEECSYYDYYNTGGEDCDIEQVDPRKTDPEYFEFDCLTVEGVEKLLNESVEKLSNSVQITPSLAKVLLHTHKWAINDIVLDYRSDSSQLLVNSKIKPPRPPELGSRHRRLVCPVCVATQNYEEFRSLACGHQYCRDCWSQHFEVQIRQGISTGIGCMAKDCEVLVTEDFVLNLLSRSSTRNRYQEFAFRDYVKTHPELRFCPGPNCPIIVRAKDPKAKRIICRECKTTFCFRCGTDYHAPTDCSTIKKWLTKCADDSETANYISAHTKDCPKCHICIEKNGGCNHMQCYNCKHDFCWMCLGDWKAHGSEYYECSRYKENPNIAHESVHAQAREALKKYLHYYERWENHSKSLKLEEQTLQKIKARINSKVMKSSGTWIDWQYLLSAAALLAKCRYTLQYTYPYAYYMDPGARKELFEYQQAHLEAEIENLSWKIEHAETTDRGDLENQMDIAEKRRTTLLKDFLEV